jgi:hypothetical protein
VRTLEELTERISCSRAQHHHALRNLWAAQRIYRDACRELAQHLAAAAAERRRHG